MESVYQNTFWFAVTLLAVLLPVYVLAVSLLGRAIGIAREEKRRIAADQEQQAKLETSAAAKELSEGQADAARTRLNLANKEEQEATKRLAKVDKRYNLLTLKCCVIIPGALLLAGAALSAAAGSLGSDASATASTFWLSVSLWILSLVLVGVALFRLIHALLVVEEVSLSSDEIAMRRNVDALKTALLAIEEEKRPELTLEWPEDAPPFKVNAGDEINIAFAARLSKGEVARNVSVFLLVPPGFQFPGKAAIRQRANHPIAPDYLLHESRKYDVLANVARIDTMTVKCCEETGWYKFYYQIACEGFSGSFEEISIEVNAVEDDPGEVET